MAASFCSNKPDVGCGRIDRIIIADRLCRWMDQFPIPSSLAMLPRFCCSFFFLFFLPGYLAISKETPGCCPPLAFIPRLFFSLSVILWFKFFCLILLFLFGLRWDIYLFLPEKRVPFQSHSAVPCLPTKFYHATPLCSPLIRPLAGLLPLSPDLVFSSFSPTDLHGYCEFLLFCKSWSARFGYDRDLSTWACHWYLFHTMCTAMLMFWVHCLHFSHVQSWVRSQDCCYV